MAISFLRRRILKKKKKIKIPFVLPSLCDGSRKCVNFCRFNALAYVDRKLMVFEELCHSCGGCLLVCPIAAIVNRFDSNLDITNLIEKYCRDEGILLLGKIPYDKQVIKAVNDGLTIVDVDCLAGREVEKVYFKTIEYLYSL